MSVKTEGVGCGEYEIKISIADLVCSTLPACAALLCYALGVQTPNTYWPQSWLAVPVRARHS